MVFAALDNDGPEPALPAWRKCDCGNPGPVYTTENLRGGSHQDTCCAECYMARLLIMEQTTRIDMPEEMTTPGCLVLTREDGATAIAHNERNCHHGKAGRFEALSE